MPLHGPDLELLRTFIKDAFSPDDLHQLVRFKLGADMYKEWVAPGLPFKDSVFKLLEALDQLGMIIPFLDAVIEARGAKDGIQAVKDVRNAIGQPTPTTTEQVDAVKNGVAGVASKIAISAVRQIVISSQAVISELAEHISLLRAYKALHDTLHVAKMQFRSLESFAKQMADPANAAVAATDFSNIVAIYETYPVRIDVALQDLPINVRQDEAEWANRFSTAVGKARKAADEIDPLASRQSIQDIFSIVRQEPSRIDGKLSRIADTLELSKLKDVFFAAANLPDLATEAVALHGGKEASEQLQRKLKAQVNQHGEWQNMDRTLSLADGMKLANLEDPWDFDAMWKTIKEASGILVAIDATSKWAVSLKDIILRVDTARSSLDWTKLAVEFSRFRQVANGQFFAVDAELQKLAGEVDDIGTPLRKLLSLL